jgi:hypothetical protein
VNRSHYGSSEGFIVERSGDLLEKAERVNEALFVPGETLLVEDCAERAKGRMRGPLLEGLASVFEGVRCHVGSP